MNAADAGSKDEDAEEEAYISRLNRQEKK